MGLGEHHLTAIRRMLARATVGPSTVRNQGAPGIAVAARSFLVELDLDPFSTSDPTAFAAELESQTLKLVAALPAKARSWGLARKCLNIFLREAFYNAFLQDRYRLDVAEKLYELPLDSISAGKLRARRPRTLPEWPGVRHLQPSMSARYQAAADLVAEEEGIVRVHLDAIFWGMDR
jgi:hypothetical protein